jgi:hypothetical protein
MEFVKIAIVGSRDYPDEQEVREFVHALPDGVIVVSGGARGVDSWAEEQAKADSKMATIFLPNYELLGLLGRFAPLARNGEIAVYADRMEAFWDGDSHGTLDAIHKMLVAGKPVNVRVKRKKP